MRYLKQSTASTIVMGPFVDSTDGVTAKTALTISQADIRISKNGGAFAQTNNATGATHMENGYYSIPLDTTDTNTVGRITVTVSESGALPVRYDAMVLSAVPYDSLIAATDNFDVSVTQWTGTNVAAPDTAGYPKVTVKSGTGTGEISLTSGIASVNATQISGDSVAADNLEAMLDGTGSVTLTTNITGNLSGSVGSVTGAVGSVTGNVGGNVSGSVGSVTGAVGSVTGNVGGNVTGSVGSVAAGGITASSIATDAVDADALASDAITEIVTGVLTTAMTESYNTDGSTATVAQALYGILQRLTEFSISGTTITVKKLDGSTTAMTLTLDSATTPTSSTRAS